MAAQQIRAARAEGFISGLMQFAEIDFDFVREETDEELSEQEKGSGD